MFAAFDPEVCIGCGDEAVTSVSRRLNVFTDMGPDGLTHILPPLDIAVPLSESCKDASLTR